MERTAGIFLLVLLACVATQARILQAQNEVPTSNSDDKKGNEKNWLGVNKDLNADEMAEYLKATYHDIRSNETGSFNGSSFTGDYVVHSYSLWKVVGSKANMSSYLIENIEVLNNSYIITVYANTQLTGGKSLFEWFTKFNVRVMVVNPNETMTTLSNSIGHTNALLNLTSSTTGVFSENMTVTVNQSNVFSLMHSRMEGHVNTSGTHSSWYGVVNGTSKPEDGAQPISQIPITSKLLDRVLRGPFKLFDAPASWTGCFSGSVSSQENVHQYNSTYSQTYHSASVTSKTSSQGSGYSWENFHAFDMDEPFNKILPALLKVLL